MDVRGELLEVERQIECGDERAKEKFWRLVGRIKRSEDVDDETVEVAARIRETIFGKRLVLGYKTGLAAFTFAFLLAYATTLNIASLEFELKYVAALFAELSTVYFAFLLGRCLASAATGIRLEGFYRYNPIEFGVKVEYRSYLKASQKARTIFFGIPILWIHLVLVSHFILLWWIDKTAAIIPGTLAATYLPFSYIVHRKLKTGELHRFLRELKILRELG